MDTEAESAAKDAAIQAKLLQRFQWKKVKAPTTWRPKTVGEQLVGFFGGKTSKNGRYGQYDVIIVHVPLRGSFMISGTGIIQLVDGACVMPGHPVCITWNGVKELGDNKTCKQFELQVAEGDPLNEELIPQLAGLI